MQIQHASLLKKQICKKGLCFTKINLHIHDMPESYSKKTTINISQLNIQNNLLFLLWIKNRNASNVFFSKFLRISINFSRNNSLCEKYPYWEYFWSVFFRIWTEHKEIQSIFRIQSECGKTRTRKTLNTRYRVCYRIHSKCVKTRTKKTPNTKIFYAVVILYIPLS